MTKVVSFSKVRKASERFKKHAKENDNAMKFGCSKLEKIYDLPTSKQNTYHADAHKRNNDG